MKEGEGIQLNTSLTIWKTKKGAKLTVMEPSDLLPRIEMDLDKDSWLVFIKQLKIVLEDD